MYRWTSLQVEGAVDFILNGTLFVEYPIHNGTL